MENNQIVGHVSGTYARHQADTNQNPPNGDEPRTFTTDEVESIIKERLAREHKRYEDLRQAAASRIAELGGNTGEVDDVKSFLNNSRQQAAQSESELIELSRLFGPTASGVAANDLAKRNIGLYRKLRARYQELTGTAPRRSTEKIIGFSKN